MDTTSAQPESCLTPDEQQELKDAWQALQAAQAPVKALVDAPVIDCDKLHDAFLKLDDAFEAFELKVMEAKQIRVLRGAQGR